MRTLLLRVRRQATGDGGMSVVELAVSMMVAGVIFAAVGTVFVGATQVLRSVNIKTATTADSRIGAEAMSRTLRVGYPPSTTTAAVRSAGLNALSFYALLNRTGATAQPAPTLVEYSWDGTCLNEATTPGAPVSPKVNGLDWTWPTGSRTSKCLVRTATPPVFSYFAGGASTTALTAMSTNQERQMIRSVQLDLRVTDPANPDVLGIPARVRVTLQNVPAPVGGS